MSSAQQGSPVLERFTCLFSDNLLLLFRFFTVHGSADETIPVEDAYEFAKLIPNHKLRIIEGANHNYTAHRKEVADTVVDFITSSEVLTIHLLSYSL